MFLNFAVVKIICNHNLMTKLNALISYERTDVARARL
jgi:hypothetical protein